MQGLEQKKNKTIEQKLAYGILWLIPQLWALAIEAELTHQNYLTKYCGFTSCVWVLPIKTKPKTIC